MTSAMTTIAAPTPMPAFAPLGSPPDPSNLTGDVLPVDSTLNVADVVVLAWGVLACGLVGL